MLYERVDDSAPKSHLAPRKRHWTRALVPGWVTWSRGRRVRGALTFLFSLTLLFALVGAGLFAYLRPDVVLPLITDSQALLVALYVIVGVGVTVVMLSIGNIVSLARATDFRRTRWGSVVLATILLVQAASFSVVGYEVSLQRELVLTVLAQPEEVPTYTPEPSASPTEPELTGTINVLLIGADAAPTRWGTRTDSLAVAHINLETGNVLMIGIPRNLHGIKFSKGSPMLRKWPNGYDCGTRCMINAVYQYAVGHAGLYNSSKYKRKDPGVEALREAVQGTLDIKVDYYVMIDMKGFAKLVDRIGGVRICVPKQVRADNGTVFKVGCQKMTGGQTLLYARTRHDSSDYYRMEKQRLVQEALIRQINGRRLLSAYNQIASSGSEYVKTDISQDTAGKLLRVAIRMANGKFTSLELVPPKVNTLNPNLVSLRKMVRQAIQEAD